LVTRTQARANISRALSRVRASRGGTTGGVSGTARVKGFVQPRATFKDVSGKAVSIPLNGKSPQQVVAEHNRKVAAIAATQIRAEQRQKAISKIGAIRKVVQKGNEITYIGFGKRSFTFPKGGMTFTGKEKFGGVISSEVALQKARQAGVKRRVTALQAKLSQRKKELKTALMAAPRDRKLEALVAKKTPIGKKKESAVKRIEREARDIRELEKQAAIRSKRAADVFRAAPLLRGDNFAQQSFRALLALPTRATVGVIEQAIISGFKLSTNIRALRTPETKEAAKVESKRAAKRIPLTIAEGYDPRKPEGLANIVGTVIAFKIARGKTNTRVAKSTATKVTRSFIKQARKTKGVRAKALRNTAKLLNRAKNKQPFLKRVVGRANSIRKQIVGKVRGSKAKGLSKRNVARELVRKLDMNKRAIKIRKAELKNTRLELIKARVSPGIRKASLKSIARKIGGLEKANKQFNTRLNKIGFSKGTRGGLRLQLKRATSRKGIDQRIQAAITKRLKSTKLTKAKIKAFAKQRRPGAKQLRKMIRKEILRKRGLPKQKQSSNTLIKNTKLFSDSMRSRIRTIMKSKSKPKRLNDLSKEYDKSITIRRNLKLQKARVKKDPFSPKTRLQELNRLNRADRQASIAQKQIQQSGQHSIQILKKPTIGKLKSALKTGKRVSRAKVQTLKNSMRNTMNGLKTSLRFAKKVKLNKTATQLSAQVIILGGLIKKADGILASGFKGRQGIKAIPISKQKKKQSVIKDVKSKDVVVPNVRVDTLPDSKIRQIINQIFGSIVGTGALAGTALFLRTPTGFKGLKGATLQPQSFSGIKQAMFRFAKRKKFVFTPDLVAILFNQVASKSQARKLTKPGRVFTGLERRFIVKFGKRKK